MRAATRSHDVPVNELENDDFQGPFEARQLALLDVIGTAMEKPILAQIDSSEADSLPWENIESKAGTEI